MKNQDENKNGNNTFDSFEFIHFTADLIKPFPYFSYLVKQHFMKYFGKIKFKRGTGMELSGVIPLVGSRGKSPNAPAILRYLKFENS